MEHGLRPHRLGGRGRRPGGSARKRLPVPATVQHLLLPLRDRDPRGVAAPRRTHAPGHALPAAAQRAPGAVRGQGPLRGGRRARPPSHGGRRGPLRHRHGHRVAGGQRQGRRLCRVRPRGRLRAEPPRARGRQHGDRRRSLGWTAASRDAVPRAAPRAQPPGDDPGPDAHPRRDAQREEPARDRARAAGLPDRRPGPPRGDAEHAAGGMGVPSSTRPRATCFS